MIRFEDGQFEIAVATYKRPEYVKIWLEKCYAQCVERNIKISIYDSSPDRKTESIVQSFIEINHAEIVYHHVDEKTIIGYKPMIPLLETKAEYLWISGDSRYHHFDELDEKVFPYIINRSVDYICFNVPSNYSLPDRIYDDKAQMIHDVFIPSTCIGLSIFRMSVFAPIKNNGALLQKFDTLFKDNYGFSWLGYFYNMYAIGDYKTLLANVEILSILDKPKKQSWSVRFYGCWVDDLCQIIDHIPETYQNKNMIPKNTWRIMRLEAVPYCYNARKHGDLNKKKLKEMTQNGQIDRITDHPGRIKFFATAPMVFVELANVLFRVYSRVEKIIKR